MIWIQVCTYPHEPFNFPTEFLITFEAWAKLAQQWFMSVPLGIHLEPINAVSDNINDN